MNENLNPVWNQTFDFVVEDGLHDMLIVEVWDHDTFGKVGVSCLLYILVLLNLTILYGSGACWKWSSWNSILKHASVSSTLVILFQSLRMGLKEEGSFSGKLVYLFK